MPRAQLRSRRLLFKWIPRPTGRAGGYKNGRLIVDNQSLRILTGATYHLPNVNNQGPPWLDEVHFDIAAKTDANVTEEATRAMLQAVDSR